MDCGKQVTRVIVSINFHISCFFGLISLLQTNFPWRENFYSLFQWLFKLCFAGGWKSKREGKSRIVRNFHQTTRNRQLWKLWFTVMKEIEIDVQVSSTWKSLNVHFLYALVNIDPWTLIFTSNLHERHESALLTPFPSIKITKATKTIRAQKLDAWETY